MKFIAIALLLIALGTATAAPQYVKLSASTINNSQLIQDLRQLGAEYVLEQGIFHSTKAPLPNGFWQITSTQSVYRKIDGGVTYYKYTVHLESQSSPITIKATYIVSFRPSNGKTLVTYYIYTILTVNDNEETTDLPQFYDTHTLDSNAYVKAIYDNAVTFTITDARAKGLIKKGLYHVGRIFSIKDQGFTDPPVFVFLVTLVNKSGYTYRASINAPDLGDYPEEEHANYPITYTIYPNN